MVGRIKQMAASADNSKVSLLVGSYTHPLGHVPQPSGKGVITTKLWVEDGGVKAEEVEDSVVDLFNPACLLMHPSGESFYAASECSDEATAAVSHVVVQGKNKGVTGRELVRGTAPCALALSSTRRWLLAANYGTGSITVSSVDSTTGEFTGARTRVVPLVGKTGPRKDRQERSHAHFVLCEGNRVVVSDLGCDLLHVFALDEESGELNAREE